MDSTAATKFNLICDNQYKVHVNSIFTYLNVYGDILLVWKYMTQWLTNYRFHWLVVSIWVVC